MALSLNINLSAWKDYLAAQASQLPPLRDVEDMGDRVVRIMGGNPGTMQLQGTNTYLVGTGKSRILIDTGQGIDSWATNLMRLLKDRDLDISYILLTHWHGDHTGGVPDLISYDPSFATRIYKNRPDPGQKPIEDGQIFQVEGATLKAVFTPGHAFDHMCFELEEENALFTGDNVLGHGYTVSEDLGAYTKSLEKMASQGCAAGYPAHGMKIDDLPTKLHQYIRKISQREKQIFSALGNSRSKVGNGGRGSLTTRELTQATHGDVPDEIFENALEPLITEVLWKLAEERKVGFEFDGSRKRWFLNERSWKMKCEVPFGAAAG